MDPDGSFRRSWRIAPYNRPLGDLALSWHDETLAPYRTDYLHNGMQIANAFRSSDGNSSYLLLGCTILPYL